MLDLEINFEEKNLDWIEILFHLWTFTPHSTFQVDELEFGFQFLGYLAVDLQPGRFVKDHSWSKLL